MIVKISSFQLSKVSRIVLKVFFKCSCLCHCLCLVTKCLKCHKTSRFTNDLSYVSKSKVGHQVTQWREHLSSCSQTLFGKLKWPFCEWGWYAWYCFVLYGIDTVEVIDRRDAGAGPSENLKKLPALSDLYYHIAMHYAHQSVICLYTKIKDPSKQGHLRDRVTPILFSKSPTTQLTNILSASLV